MNSYYCLKCALVLLMGFVLPNSAGLFNKSGRRNASQLDIGLVKFNRNNKSSIFASLIQSPRPRVYSMLESTQLITFELGNTESTQSNHIYKQTLNQTTVNYCNFDPNQLSQKRFDGFAADISVKQNVFNEASRIASKSTFTQKIYYIFF